MYSLLSASVIGFDLVRRPGGGHVASLVVGALGVSAEDLPLLAKARPLGRLTPADHAEVSATTARSPMVMAMGETTRLVGAGRVGDALALLESAPLAGLDELLRCVRTDVFDWTWTGSGTCRAQSEVAGTAVEVVCDSIMAAYHAPQLGPALSEQLVEPWAAARQLLPRRAVGLGPCEPELVALLEALAAADEAAWQGLLEIGRASRARSGWAPAMHSATLAVHLSGRVREAAAAQLRAVRVLSDRDLSVTDAARGVWNVVSGAVQATAVLDLLDDDTAGRLLEPVRSLLTGS